MTRLPLYALLTAVFTAAAPVFSETVPGGAWNGPPVQSEPDGQGAPAGLLGPFLEPGFPSTLQWLMEGNYTRDSARLLSTPGAGISDLLPDEGRLVGTGLGLDLGPGIKFQGFGLYDMEEGSTFAGPALRYDLPGDLDFTTGVQIPLNDRREISSGSADFYYAEFRLLF